MPTEKPNQKFETLPSPLSQLQGFSGEESEVKGGGGAEYDGSRRGFCQGNPGSAAEILVFKNMMKLSVFPLGVNGVHGPRRGCEPQVGSSTLMS